MQSARLSVPAFITRFCTQHIKAISHAMFFSRASALGFLMASVSVSSQSFVPFPHDVSTIQSVNYPGSSISYKKVRLHIEQKVSLIGKSVFDRD